LPLLVSEAPPSLTAAFGRSFGASIVAQARICRDWQTVGRYQILAELGRGGMGEVYRAKDTKLDRDVAIKVLPESFAVDADRAARFTREAKTLASLNHPNIAAIYGIEEQGSTRALVMELVEGWVAYDTDKSGTFEVVVQAFPVAKGKWPASTAGGSRPRWSRDGRELYFVGHDSKLMATPVRATGESFEAGTPAALFQMSPDTSSLRAPFDVTAAGTFVVAEVDALAKTPPIVVARPERLESARERLMHKMMRRVLVSLLLV
jgi:Protein kinase domain